MEENIGVLELKHCNKKYNVMRCETHFLRHHNVHYPDANPVCDKIRLTIIIDDSSDLTIQEWYMNQDYKPCNFYYNLEKNIDINQNLDVYANQTRCLQLSDCLCFSMKEVYDINEDNPTHQLVIELFPTSVIINNDTRFDLQ